MKIEILTIFPEIFSGFLNASLIQKAIDRNLFQVTLTNIRDFADPPHNKVDDTPYGGGAGMVFKPEPIVRAVEAAKTNLPNAIVVLMSASGKTFTQTKAEDLSKKEDLIFICGRYEGVDKRVIDLVVDEEISIGNYILMGGEVPSMAIIESIIRLNDGILGNPDSIKHESFHNESLYLEAPQYTRPIEYRGLKVPDVLLSGNHKKIAEWREMESKKLTALRE